MKTAQAFILLGSMMQQPPHKPTGPRAETQAPAPLSNRARLHADFDPLKRLKALLALGQGLAPVR
ncbi:MAG: hypothetical protein ACKOBA_09120, partial [Limnohabitans sp.]